MRAIFISYRRDDSEGEAGRLFDDLVEHFGEDAVFMDVTAIAPGRDFRKAIDESVATCGVLLAIIGQNWVEAKNDAGQRRLDDPMDFVRLETASALKRDIPVVPVLIRGAKMPRLEQLPDDVKDLAYRNAVELTHARWTSDVQLLIRALRPLVPDLSAGAASAQESLGPAPAAPSTVDVSRSRGNPPDGARPVDRQPEHGGGAGPGSSPTRSRQTKWLAVAGGILVVLALAGYGVYSSFTGDRAKQTADQQRRAAEEEAAKRRTEAERTEAERTEFARKKADLERDAAKFASDRAAAEKAATDKAAADKTAADRAEAERRREAAEASRRAAADKAATEKSAADRAESDRRREAAEAERRAAAERAAAERTPSPPPSSARIPTPPGSYGTKFAAVSCTDLGAGRFRIETTGSAFGGGDVQVSAGVEMLPVHGRTIDGKTTCSNWSGVVRASTGAVSDRHCKRGDGESTRTDWKSSHVIEWRPTEPPSRALSMVSSAGVIKVSEHALLKCVR